MIAARMDYIVSKANNYVLTSIIKMSETQNSRRINNYYQP